MRSSTLAACAVLGATLLASGRARAQANTSQANAGLMPTPSSTDAKNDPTLAPVFPERRNGGVLGAASGIGFAGADGFPNGAKFGNQAFYSSSPLLVGYDASFFVMGALSDYVSFGPMFTFATFENDKWKSTGWGLGFRAEVFPLVKVAPFFADTAVFSQLGVGQTDLRAKGPFPEAGGTQSFLGIGLHNEWRLARFLGGHASAGPFVEYDVIHTESAERHWLTIGLRVVWYGGGVKLDRVSASRGSGGGAAGAASAATSVSPRAPAIDAN